MFPFKKKADPMPAKAVEPDHGEAVRKSLAETDTRLGEAIKEMRRRLDEKARKLTLVGHN